MTQPQAPNGTPPQRSATRRSPLHSLTRWFDSWSQVIPEGEFGIDWIRALPFVLLHVACIAVIWVGWSPIALGVAAALYAVRMFAITGFYHRYFSHRTYRTGRFWQFVFAVVGNSAVQRGPLWWAAHHRHHHRVSDSPEDTHSPARHGFLKSHIGWILDTGNFRTRLELVPDLAKFRELRFLDRFDSFVPFLLALSTFALGSWLAVVRPEWHTSGWQMLVWGFVISTVVTSHATFTINSLSHLLGRQRYDTGDDSRNNPFLALLTFGEGWHNNHHKFPTSVRQGFYWWELDLTWLGLLGLRALGIVRDLKPIPVQAFEKQPRDQR
ncbi:MAG: fatty acid desaturase [Planctomycetes bacterium]|nr:fatty acid desaturase [Planctomycetota bacterium]